MDKKRNSKNNFEKRQIKMIPQTYRHNKLGTSKLSNFTVNSISIKSNCHLRDSSEKNSKDFHNNLMNKSNNNNSKSNINKLRTTYKPTSHSNKKIYIKIQQKTEYNIILDRTLHTFDKNNKINKSLRKKNKTNNNSKNIKIMKKLRNTTSENRNKIKNKNISDFINVSFGDSSIEINKPKKSENYIFNDFNGRKSNIPHPYRNILYDKLYNKEENKVNEIKNKQKIKNKKLKDIQREFNENNNKLENVKKIHLYNSNKYDKDLNINCFMNENENINNEFFRLSRISKYNNNDLDYLNNKNANFNDFLDNRYSYSINQKVGNYINKFDDKNKSVDDKKEKDNNIISAPCMNCGKMINLNEIDEHSNNCFEMKEEESTMKKNNYISFVENKLKNIYEYINKFNSFTNLKLIIEETLSIKNINSSSIKELKKINDNLKYIMEKYYNSTNIFTLLSRVNILLEEKIKYFIKNNIIVNNNKVKKLNNSNFSYNKNNKALRNTINCPQIDKKLYLNYDNSLDGAMSESETMEFFDLKKMERILDKKKKTDNLDNFINEAKNKRLFLMEVLKVKYQKISENKLENLIPPILIWKEALKKNIKMKNWTKFIFEELNNPDKYLNLREKIKDKNKENLFNLNDK